ncbi:hypothetical protein IKG33_01625 [Candidatus Saccharibacteria bacterium]|nr:hypothetical protein [Candidatus Saccharibacteria bacterium]
MKKKIAIGLAAVALAAMPMLNVMAIGESFTDTIVITINDSCTFARHGTTPHTNGDGTWGSGATADTLSATRSLSSLSNNLGKSTFIVGCNLATGYKVTVATTALVHGTTNSITIPNNTTYSASASGWSPKSTNGTGGTRYVNNNTVNTNSTPVAANTSFDVYYGVGISATQAAGTYTGTATYTQAAL